MNTELLRSIRKHSLMLACFAAGAALILGLVKLASEDRITQQRLASERRALYEVLPPASHNNDLLSDRLLLGQVDSNYSNLELLGLSEERYAYVARQNNTVSGIILPVEAHDGYSGDILILVGINIDASLSGVRVLNHRETPGLGDKIDLRVSDWILAFNNHSLNNPQSAQWLVKKDGGEFDQFVGATITPRAMVNAVQKALMFFEQNQQQLFLTQNQYEQ